MRGTNSADWHPCISKRISVEQHGELTVTGGYEPKLIIIIPSYLFTVHIGAELKLANTLAERVTPHSVWLFF